MAAADEGIPGVFDMTPDLFAAQFVQIASRDGQTVKISPYGAHVLSWVTADGDERLFLSPKAEFRSGAAIRGGVPVIFPQFAEMGNLPKHGFARNRAWKVARVTADRAVFRLSESEATRQIWPHRFLAEYTVHIDQDRLEMALSITNTDRTPFAFTAALHTYLRVQTLDDAAVLGLQGLLFRDSTQADRESRDVCDRVTFPGEVDRIYLGAPAPLRLIGGKRDLVIGAEGFPDAVIWNPGPEKCARLPDMEADGYRRFVCVEAAAAQPIGLVPAATWLGKQVLSI